MTCYIIGKSLASLWTQSSERNVRKLIITLWFSVRKSADELKKALESVVVPMFCNTYLGVTEEQQAKLNKVIDRVQKFLRTWKT